VISRWSWIADHWSLTKFALGLNAIRRIEIRPFCFSSNKIKSLVPEGEAQSADILIPDTGVLMV
jgi:hypothetical protein